MRAIVVKDNHAQTMWPDEQAAAIAIASGALAPEGMYLHVDYIRETLLGFAAQLPESSTTTVEVMETLAEHFATMQP